MKKMQPLSIIRKYYSPQSTAYRILLVHSEMVAQKSVQLAARVAHLNPDVTFVHEAAMLHDIGMFLTDSPDIGCHGGEPYIKHGILGRELLEREGYPRHALVCERHIGVGISREDIMRENLPLPPRDMLPVTVEEKIVCFADCFFGKNPDKLRKEKSLDKISKSIAKWGPDNLARLQELRELFGL